VSVEGTTCIRKETQDKQGHGKIGHDMFARFHVSSLLQTVDRDIAGSWKVDEKYNLYILKSNI
jgi:hypothetical protein